MHKAQSGSKDSAKAGNVLGEFASAGKPELIAVVATPDQIKATLDGLSEWLLFPTSSSDPFYTPDTAA